MSGMYSAIAIGVSGVAQGVMAKQAADTSARATRQAAQTSADVQREMFNKQVELQAPWREAGMNALERIKGGFTGDVNLAQDPGYAFRLAEGQKALERTAAARGGLLSGGAMREAQRYGQGMASQEYANAYNRALTQYNTLANIAGVGQTSAGQMAGEAGQLGANLGNTYYNAGTAEGQARASGYLGVGNALSSAIGSGLNYYQGMQGLNYLKGLNPSSVPTGGSSPIPGAGSNKPFFIP